MSHIFKLEIETGNAAFGETTAERADELARILAELSEKVAWSRDTEGYLSDVNGNRVGKWSLTKAD